MRRLALLVAGGALWLFVAAIPAFADGGPHIANVNNGTGGLNADTCAQCHRAHTAQGENLLYTDANGICLSCHAGGNATTNVNLGVQYMPSGILGYHTGTTIGALRGGGFQYALIGTANRETYYSQPQYVKFTGFSVGDQFTLTFAGQTTAAITFAGQGTSTEQTATKNNIQTALVALSNVGYTAGQSGLYAQQPNMTVSWSASNGWFGVTLQNGLVTAKDVSGNSVLQPLMTGAVVSGSGSLAIDRSSDPALRAMPRVGVGTSQPVTSIHDAGPGVVWGNGGSSAGVGFQLASDQELDCTECHNPHGNNSYRILRSDPGEGWSTTAVPFPNGNPVIVPDDSTVNPQSSVRNYTVLPAPLGQPNTALAVAAAFTNTQGDYIRRKVPAWNITNFSGDPITAGWNQDAAKPNVTEWCISCHTRYNGITDVATGEPSSLVPPDPNDPHFKYKHGTQNVGCLACHVSHGSNVMMTGNFSENYTNPAGSPQYVWLVNGASVFVDPGTGPGGAYSGDSRLLKAPDRGTCQLCHDPTSTVQAGTIVGPSPAPVAP